MMAWSYIKALPPIALELLGFWASGAWFDGEARRDLRVAIRDCLP